MDEFLEHHNSKQEKSTVTFSSGAYEFVRNGPLNALLIFVPIAFFCWSFDAPEIATFIFSLLAIVPLSERLGFVTEQLALHTNPTIGGLLNVTFGNATELIVSIVALFHNFYRLVQLSLLGSIISNMLLVLGTAFWIGGVKNGTQTFRVVTGQVNSTILVIGSMTIVLPYVLGSAGQASSDGQLMFSRIVSLVMIILYLCYVYMELRSDMEITPKDSSYTSSATDAPSDGQHGLELLDLQSPNAVIDTAQSHFPPNIDPQINNISATSTSPDDDDEDEILLTFWGAIFWLAVITGLVAVLSEALVRTIDEASAQAGVNSVFVSTILLPCIGNASEHSSAIIFAFRNKMDVAVSIAVGSSTQIAVFVIPLLVVIAWCADKALDLNFHALECYSLLLTVIGVTFAIQGGKSSWIVGVALVCGYFILSVGFYIHNDEHL